MCTKDDLKRCGKCKIRKPLAEFSKHKDNKDGLQYNCKQCIKDYKKTKRAQYLLTDREYQKRNHEKIKQRMDLYRKRNKETMARYFSAYRKEHADKISSYQKTYRKNHKARLREYLNLYYNCNLLKFKVYSNTRRVFKLNSEGSHTAQELADLWIEQEGLCAYCGCDLEDNIKELDHIVPLKKGGSNWISNLAWACRTCNRSKGAKLLSEWKPSLDIQ